LAPTYFAAVNDPRRSVPVTQPRATKDHPYQAVAASEPTGCGCGVQFLLSRTGLWASSSSAASACRTLADPELHSPVTPGATTSPGSPITGPAATAAALRS